ncbi:hypothetical protein [Aequorivita vladivostokensis]|uniref:Uncharacterized protein n=1 Tax=Aequorivita vladivostokensis TaxID=171194 RepID=A0ABR5DIZ0_9FLAO|nr:hypothetical protein [Aequorivita vladivostokensis]KJJ38737.1 hypothetical protein MB09_08645 [Aequorivita vladivostokensis]
MDEFDIKVLEVNGYSYIDRGIVDAEGNYVSTLELNGKILKSESSKELWNRGQALEKKYSTSTIPNENVNKDGNTHLTNVLTDDKGNFSRYKDEQSLEKPINHIANNTSFDFYTYSLVLVGSIIIYLIIKKITK